MLVDVRTYRIRPSKMAQELELYAKYGLNAQTRHLGPPLAYLYGESGDINTLVHLWTFENAGDRAERRGAMARDPEWQPLFSSIPTTSQFLIRRDPTVHHRILFSFP